MGSTALGKSVRIDPYETLTRPGPQREHARPAPSSG